MQFVNLTPHDLNVVAHDGSVRVFPKSGSVARVSVQRLPREGLDGVLVSANVYGDVEGLPEPVEGVALVVSALVLARVPNRLDVFAPGELVRDEGGNVVGCKGLTGNPLPLVG